VRPNVMDGAREKGKKERKGREAKGQ